MSWDSLVVRVPEATLAAMDSVEQLLASLSLGNEERPCCVFECVAVPARGVLSRARAVHWRHTIPVEDPRGVVRYFSIACVAFLVHSAMLSLRVRQSVSVNISTPELNLERTRDIPFRRCINTGSRRVTELCKVRERFFASAKKRKDAVLHEAMTLVAVSKRTHY
mgnify:CR=1 FL=1